MRGCVDGRYFGATPVSVYLGGASLVLHLRDSRLWWGVDTERGWVNSVGAVMFSGCWLVAVTPGGPVVDLPAVWGRP